MKKYIKKLKVHEIEIYESLIWTSLVCVSFYISYMGVDGIENSIYNFVENILS